LAFGSGISGGSVSIDEVFYPRGFFTLSEDIWNSMTKENFVELFLSCEALKSVQIDFELTLFVEGFHFAEAITACRRSKGASTKRVKE
jgi:hypothetical protein